MGRILDPLTLHVYSYAAADPVGKVDPTGRSPMISSMLSVMGFGLLSLGMLAVGLRAINRSRCQVDVRATRVRVTGWLPNYHLFFVCRDESGLVTYYRGGSLNPCLSDGYQGISTKFGEYLPGTVDWSPGAPSVTVMDGPAACDKGRCFARELENIGCVPYHPLGPNSNTVVSTLMNKCNVPRRKPVAVTIGWGQPDL